MEKNERPAPGPQDPGEGHGLANVLKLILLVSILAGAWFLLDRLINGK
jgi:hypothetical protein